jgi:cyclohexyl-isocyanide hydratase
MAHAPHPATNALSIGMLLYPGCALQDLGGLQSALGLHARTLLFWKTLAPVPADTGVLLSPTTTFADAPAALDVLFAPGGPGADAAAADAEIVEFLARMAPRSLYVTAVGPGSRMLDTAGLLEGYSVAKDGRYTTRWKSRASSPQIGGSASQPRNVYA